MTNFENMEIVMLCSLVFIDIDFRYISFMDIGIAYIICGDIVCCLILHWTLVLLHLVSLQQN
jgi:hypothetical protein